MAEILSSCQIPQNDSLLSFLIVSQGKLLEDVFQGLRIYANDKKYRVNIHRTESISDVLSYKSDLDIDYIVLAFDGSIKQQLLDVEKELLLLDEFFIISGRVCLVNCYGFPHSMRLVNHAAIEISEKFRLPLLSCNITSQEGLISIGQRVFSLAEALTGVLIGFSDLNMLTTL